MDFGFTEDQTLLVQTLDRWATDHMEIPADSRTQNYLAGDALATDLAAQGYYEVADGFGMLGAVLVIEAVGRTPWAVEVAASALIAPMLRLADLPRPLALLSSSGPPVARFLVADGAALVDAGDHLRLLRCDNRVEPAQNPYAYPFGRFDGDLIDASEPLDGISIEEFRTLRLVAASAEAVAAMEAALNLTVEYVRTRVQFGRPIGSFQTVQHRLSECSALLHGARLLLYRAAVEGLAYAPAAAIVTHDTVKRVLYETNQFHGAIGLTLEYPLHLWSYRLRILQSELSGAAQLPGSSAGAQE